MNDQKKCIRLYDLLNREGKGVLSSDVVTTTGLKGFFYRYKLCFGKLLSINIIYVLGNIFLIFLVLTLAGYTKINYFTPDNDFFSLGFSTLTAQGNYSAADLTTLTLLGGQSTALANTTWTYVFWCLSALTLLTFGCVNVGTAYLLRNLSRGDPVFVVSDFFYAVKRNYKQAIPMGILDGIILCLLPYNIYTMLIASGGFFTGFILWMNIMILLLYFIMRFYIYILMLTFDLSFFKILKNAFIFTLLGIKRNTMALLWIVLLFIIEYFFLLIAGGYLLPLAIGFPLMILFSHASFGAIYASYYVIKKYMIDPNPQNQGQVSDTIEESKETFQ